MDFNADCDKKTGDGDDNFVWQDYLEVTNSVEVPQVLFSHVEQSLLSGLQEGMLLEVPHKLNPNMHWLASIIMACGPLLRLRYVGQEEDRSQDFWCDVTKVSVHPLGWCKERGLQLDPPAELQQKLADHRALITIAVQDARSVPPELLTGDGFTPVDRIKQGMKVEVQDKQDPKRLWVATIIENVGGRLLLRYDTPDSSSPDFWLFYSSPRLFRMGWVTQKGPPWVLRWPSYMKTHHGTEEWEAVMEMAKEDARRVPLPPDLFQNVFTPTPHHFVVGMKLEAVHPHNMVEVCPGSVVKVFDQFYFLIQIDSHGSMETDAIESTWLCTSQHPYIFPVGWAQANELQLTHPRGWTTAEEEFDWAEYLAVTNSQPATKSGFAHQTSAKELGFKPGMKLEAVNPENQHQICAASVVKVIDHLLWIHLDSNDSFHPCHIVSVDSLEIFPVGWCESNSYPLKAPHFYQSPVKPQPQHMNILERKENGSSPIVQQRSFWCPKIYFNHKCFSGPFLSKGKLAQLPKAVGPGPVTLVMREVLAMLISVAYKSSRVLKELQTDGKPEPGMHLEVLKAKYKTNTYRASVAVVTSADQVPAFCKAVCERLQVCRYMFGPVAVGENNCPEGCSNLSKTRFTQYWVQGKRKIGRPKGETSNMVPRPKKKRGRKRLIGTHKVEADTNHEIENIGSNLDPVPPECTASPQEDNESDTNSSLGLRRKYCKKEFPRTVMKTRGAKLPNFALQMRAGHWPQKQWSSLSTDSVKHTVNINNSSLDSTHSQKCTGGERQDETCPSLQPEKNDMESERVHNTIEDQSTSFTKDQIELDSNPLYWSEDDVYRYLMKTDDCAWVAQRCKDEMIDGQAFMMLNLPTLQEHLYLKMGPAMKLCHHIEQIKLAFYMQYITGSEP